MSGNLGPIRAACALALVCTLSQAAQLERFGGDRASEPIRFGDPAELAYEQPFFEGANYDPLVPTPEAILGQALGSRISHHAEIAACFRRWAELSPRMLIESYARSHEGRELMAAVVSSPQNIARLDAILSGLERLSDPRDLSNQDAEAIAAATPAVAWLGYSIHGDELSGADAALALGYHLAASTDAEVVELLERLVVVIDPCMNPDGRERIVGQIEQGAGSVHNLDYAAMQRGRWPWGRGNHYLFDMNRDWMAGTQPETRGRWRAAFLMRPQLFIDAHEMWEHDTFLFYPQAEPYNPFLPAGLESWQEKFGADQAEAFDRRGWAYYTREWADAWAPFYSDAWGSLNGAIGILYEQSRTSGYALRRESGRVLTYRESVHHQVVSSWANLQTLARNARAILRDYVAFRRSNVSADPSGQETMFVLRPGRNATRERELVDLLQAQGVEIERAAADFEAHNARTTLGDRHESLMIPKGALIVRVRQPQGPIVKAYLSFDVRLDESAALAEREELERRNRSKIYDDTAWSLPLAFDLDALWCDAVELPSQPAPEPELPQGEIIPPGEGGESVAWIADGSDDAALRFAAAALELGLAVHSADRAFSAAGLDFTRGSLLVRRNENAEDVEARVARAAERARVSVHAVAGARSTGDGPDLGGQHFRLLARPRVAMLGNDPVWPDAFGHLWHLLDREIGLPVSVLDAPSLSSYDLRRYNVLVLPPCGEGLDVLLKLHATSLREWIRAGGTLIACGNAAGRVAQRSLELSAVVRRQDALKDLELYADAVQRERSSRSIELDYGALWGDEPAPPPEPDGESKESKGDDPPKPEDEEAARLEARDAWQRRFSPRGVFLRGRIDPDSWISSGCDGEAPVYFSGEDVLLAREPVRTAVRLSERSRLRLSGLLWPEAAERLADSAYLTQERVGQGQVILFAAQPGYRGYVRSSGRLFANAVVLGPGLGASAPIGR